METPFFLTDKRLENHTNMKLIENRNAIVGKVRLKKQKHLINN